ncbi:MAG: hypothetical protein SFT92_03485 [Rickettsiales bacterium]|nr:hypothetical protein [Rickettsiales bacterium]
MRITLLPALFFLCLPYASLANDSYNSTSKQTKPYKMAQLDDSYDDNEPMQALPLEVHEVNGVRYVTGGIGDEEITMLKQVENEFNTRILLSSKKGEYISLAQIRIFDAAGNEVVTDGFAGPYFYASLPPGKYSVDVLTMKGYTGHGTFTAPKTGFVKPVLRFGPDVKSN